MNLGGITTNPRMHLVFRTSALVLPLLIAVFYVLVYFHLVKPNYPIIRELILPFAALWATAGITQYVLARPTKINTGVRVVVFHILAMFYTIFIVGVASPLGSLWVVLSFVTYGFFGLTGLYSSLSCLVISMIADAFLHHNTPGGPGTGLLIGTAYFLITAILVYIVRFQERDEAEFRKTREDELLQRERIITLINNLADGILSTNQKGTIQVYNAAVLGLLDTNLKLQGESIDNIIHLTTKNGEAIRIVPLLHKAKSVTIRDDLVAHIGDETMRMELTYAPIRRGYRKGDKTKPDDGYVIILRDITKTKSLEEERDEFVSVASHELRTPIAITEGAIDNARLVFEKNSSKVDLVKSALSTAHEQILFLSKMVNDLGTLSRAERNAGDSSELIDVAELMQGLYSEYLPEATKKGLRLNLAVSGNLGSVKASRLYLHELLQNFITNSIKYTREGHIDLIADASHDRITFTVKDTGIGISKSDQTKIFQKFWRSEDYRTRETGGTGLGLYIATKLARKLETVIQFQSRLNHGSSFSINLPQTDENASEKKVT